MLHCLNKLTKLPIGVEHLQATGIGRTINGMRKVEGAVGEEARALVNKWKEMVAAEDKSDSDAQEDDATSQHQLEATSDQNSGESPSYRKKDKDLKKKESPKEKAKEEPTTSCKSKKSMSRGKSPEKNAAKPSKGSEKKKDSKDSHSSKSSSKSSRKRHHSQDESNSTEEEEDGEASSLSFADALGSIETVSKKKKSKEKEKEKHKGEKKKIVSTQPSVSEPSFIPPPKQSLPPPKSLDIRPTDFEISPHYKPLPLKFVTDSPLATKEKTRNAEEALSVAMAQKGSRYLILIDLISLYPTDFTEYFCKL